MKQCPYAVRFLSDVPVKPALIEARCERRDVLGSPGWHLHDAPVPWPLLAQGRTRIRWRSTNTPDHYVREDS